MENMFIKIKNAINEFLKFVIKKLDNFRLTAFICSCVSVLVAIVGALNLVFYEFAGPKGQTAQITAFNERPIAGCFFFLANLISIIIAIFGTYLLFPAVRNKEKIAISKAPLIMAIANAALQIVSIVFTIILLTSGEEVKTAVGFIICLVLSIILTIASMAILFPLLKCAFYMPPIAKKE